MQQKFLAGEDTEHLDYSKIHADHSYTETTKGAKDKYFDED